MWYSMVKYSIPSPRRRAAASQILWKTNCLLETQLLVENVLVIL